MEKLLKWIEDIFVKHHKCEKYEVLFSSSYEDHTLVGIETRCDVCGNIIKKVGW